MALTPLIDSALQVIYSGPLPPSIAPAPQDPQADALYQELDSFGNVISVSYWSIANQAWVPSPGVAASANWSEGLECGWQGPHNRNHWAPGVATIRLPGIWTPYFAVTAVSASPIAFELQDRSSGTPVLVASGVFPAGAVHADAASVSLVDPGGAPFTSALFVPSAAAPVALLSCVPVGGHAAMPADGEGFTVSFSIEHQ